MAPIKEFLANCYQGLTSLATLLHRFVLAEEKTLVAGTSLLHRLIDLACGNSQEPDQHSKKNQRAQNREEGVQRVELEVRIAPKTISCCQHGTSFLHRLDGAMDGLSHDYCPTFELPVPVLCAPVINHCHA